MRTFKLDGEISWFDYDGDWGKFIGPRSVAAFLKGLKDGETAEIEINSPGGDVVSGLAIANSIKNSKAHIRGHVVGIAASMASAIACACDELVMEEGSFLMVHNPWTDATGDAEALRHKADVLDSMKDALIAFYRGKFGGTAEQLSALMDGETWMNGREAQASGFLCEVVATDVQAAAVATPRALANAPEAAKAFFRRAEIPEELKERIAAGVAENPDFADLDAGEPDKPAPVPAPEPAVDWEARYKGACKAINEARELRAKLDEAEARIATAEGERDAARAANGDLDSQLVAVKGDLEKAKADFSRAVARAENAEKDLAAKGEQLERLEKAHRLLTGGVLHPSPDETIADAKKRELAAAGTAEERERIRAKYRRLAK